MNLNTSIWKMFLLNKQLYKRIAMVENCLTLFFLSRFSLVQQRKNMKMYIFILLNRVFYSKSSLKEL